jgi:hypothetical protein
MSQLQSGELQAECQEAGGNHNNPSSPDSEGGGGGLGFLDPLDMDLFGRAEALGGLLQKGLQGEGGD